MQNIRDRNYTSREEFLEHCNLLVTNSTLYNGIDILYLIDFNSNDVTRNTWSEILIDFCHSFGIKDVCINFILAIGGNHALTKTAQEMYNICTDELEKVN